MSLRVEALPKVLLAELPSGEAGVRETLSLMRFLVRRSKSDPAIRAQALAIVGALPQRDYAGEVRALHAWVRDCIRYVRDIRGIETLHTPRWLLKERAGDCDDKSLLLASLLESIGTPTRFAAMGLSPGALEHVLLEARVGRRWVPLETTEPVRAGWFPAGVKRLLIVHN
jgi:transglutaminase-like putative cysteine protease